ncbi:MAG: lipoate--protein ligase family protein [Bacteroidales bacterium]|nr:lipoate--protein ligase family protein [Bacteroidales bacterium]
MKKVVIPDCAPRRLTFFLSAEEYLAQGVGEDLFFTWQSPPTVICGRNQIIENEVNLEYCREHAIEVVRRKSGGGCVYSDAGNVMLSYITPERGVEEVFARFLDMVAGALRDLGFDAVTTAHNDILVSDRKVSGNACFALPGATIVHGTMLYDLDFDALEKATTPSQEKLSKHGVQSVRQRVVNLKSLGLQMDAAGLRRYFEEKFCDGELKLTADDIEKIVKFENLWKRISN